MEYADVMQLVGMYLGAFTGVFVLAYGPRALWKWFKEITSPNLKIE